MPRRRLTGFLLASVFLISLISSCATTKPPRGFDFMQAGSELDYDAYCVDEDGARDVSVKLEERRDCLDRMGEEPTLWDRITHNVTILGIGAGLGFVGALVIAP